MNTCLVLLIQACYYTLYYTFVLSISSLLILRILWQEPPEIVGTRYFFIHSDIGYRNRNITMKKPCYFATTIASMAMAMTTYRSTAAATDSHAGTLLHYYHFDHIIPCGDGSPAGFYTDAYNIADGVTNNNHIINFEGGGGCGSDSSCNAIWELQPFKLSSLFDPPMIDGSTILSNDASENPAMASFTKWNVPYILLTRFMAW